MDFGISTFVTDETPSPGDIGRLVEGRGFTALFVAEHPHMPHDTVRDVDRKYYRSLDPFVTLAAAGVDRVLFMLPSTGPAEMERAADEAVAVAERFGSS